MSLPYPAPTRMNVLGIDFTSRPTRRKPISCLHCILEGDVLRAGDLEKWTDFDAFELVLQRPGPWIAGIDFPFGQARRFIETIGWPRGWQDYVRHAQSLTRSEFREELNAYRRTRRIGDKEHRRQTDVAAGSVSPQKLYGVPVGLMFFEGAPRLLASNVTIPMLQEGDPKRIVVEAYPGVLARQLIGNRSYKHDTRKKQTPEQLRVRLDLLEGIVNGRLHNRYGFGVKAQRELCEDPGGDHLDALLCAIQAAWAWQMGLAGFRVPNLIDPLEGWIADPLPFRSMSNASPKFLERD
jgi:hypothetical protein